MTELGNALGAFVIGSTMLGSDPGSGEGGVGNGVGNMVGAFFMGVTMLGADTGGTGTSAPPVEVHTQPLAGTISGGSTGAGTLGTFTALAGHASGSATVAGRTTLDLEAGIDGGSAVQAALYHPVQLTGAIDPESVVQADAVALRQMGVSISGEAETEGSMGVSYGLRGGLSVGMALVGAQLRMQYALGGEVPGAAQVSGNPSLYLRGGLAAGESSVTANPARVAALIVGQADVLATLYGQVSSVEGSAGGTATTAGWLTRAFPVLGNIGGTSAVAAEALQLRLLAPTVIQGEGVATGQLEQRIIWPQSIVAGTTTEAALSYIGEVSLAGLVDAPALVDSTLLRNTGLLPETIYSTANVEALGRARMALAGDIDGLSELAEAQMRRLSVLFANGVAGSSATADLDWAIGLLPEAANGSGTSIAELVSRIALAASAFGQASGSADLSLDLTFAAGAAAGLAVVSALISKTIGDLDGTANGATSFPGNSVDMDLELKSSMKGRPVGIAEVVADFEKVVVRFLLLHGSAAVERILSKQIEGWATKSSASRRPMTITDVDRLMAGNGVRQTALWT